jgi:hypothetical protein
MQPGTPSGHDDHQFLGFLIFSVPIAKPCGKSRYWSQNEGADRLLVAPVY